MVHVVKETDAGIVIRGAKYETAAAYADQAFLKPTVGAWTNETLSDYAVGGIIPMNAPGVKHICRSSFAGRTNPLDYPLANKFDEVDFARHLRQCADPLGERVLLPPHQGRAVHSRRRCTATRRFPTCTAFFILPI